ncbi:MAG: vWA domain-containing protein [Myxococcota bacterium]
MARALAFVPPLAAAAVALVGAGACDTGAKFYQMRAAFSHAEIVSAYPGRAGADGRWSRVCDDGPVDGIITNVAFVATEPKLPPGTPLDTDLAVHPGDLVDMRAVEGPYPDDIHLTTPGGLGLAMDCLDPAPENDPGTCHGAVPAAALERVDWVGTTADRSQPHEVIVLVDQSGSIGGLVDAANGFLEPQGNDPGQLPSSPGDVASDKYGSRFRALTSFILSLNASDRLGIVAFGEGQNGGADLAVPCAGASGQDIAAGLAACFGTNHDLWMASTGIGTLLGHAAGRSNLWKAIDFAYGWLADPSRRRPAGASRHIVVLTDGPDTCAGEAQTPRTAACSSVLAQEVLDRIAADQADPDGPDIHIDFVQFEAPGYPGRDPRQIDAACLSGGHYRYVNSNAFVSERVAALDAALTEAFGEIRLTLGGHWALASSVPAWVSDDPAPTGTPAGGIVYALSGRLTISASSHLVTSDTVFPFGVGQGVGAASATAWDRRPSLVDP